MDVGLIHWDLLGANDANSTGAGAVTDYAKLRLLLHGWEWAFDCEFSSVDGLPAGLVGAGFPLQSVYSRRWKNTAVYGASQVQTTICCDLFAIAGLPPQNIGLLLWKAHRMAVDSGSGLAVRPEFRMRML
jgi:hypothetical protein